MSDDEKEKFEHAMTKAAQEGAAAETVQRYGSAVKEYGVAYSGLDNEAGKTLKKSLKGISQERINPDFKRQNIKQQAGFSAEILDMANENADNIINGSPVRKMRTDDLLTTSDPVSGKTVGGTNDQLFDHVELDALGNIVPHSAAQMKFVGGSPEECYSKLKSIKYQKYFDANAKIEVPSDFYDGVLKSADDELASLKKQLEYVQANGNTEAEAKIKENIAKTEKIKSSLKKSSVSNKEAVQARLHPELATAVNVAKVAHKAGVEQTKYGAAIGGAVSLVQNLVAVVKGQKEPVDAALDVCKDTGAGAASGYVTAFTGSIIKGGMQNSANSTIRTLAKTNIAATVVTSTLDMGRTFRRYFAGEIDGAQCIEDLGQSGVNQISTAMFGMLGNVGATQVFGNGAAITIGQLAIPIPVVGGIIGAMVGCALSSACYGELATALKEARLAREERLKIEAECAKLVKMVREYRVEAERMVNEYLSNNITTFNEAFAGITAAARFGDVDAFIQGNNAIQESFGKTAQFNSMAEFDNMMASSVALKL